MKYWKAHTDMYRNGFVLPFFQKLRIHREGYSVIAAGLLSSIGLAIVSNQYLPKWFARTLTFILGSINLLIVWFFRNPWRPSLYSNSTIIAPASGTVVAVEYVDESEYIQQRCIKIAIFLSVFNVHVNAIPVSGDVVYRSYHPGKYLAAFHPKASELNECSVTALKTSTGHTILIRQIAGIVARRISTYIHEGDAVQCGDELGFIKFGSRVELSLPLSSEIAVHVGSRVKVGVTPLAALV
jgi:phosphatidylserine decarboxylase